MIKKDALIEMVIPFQWSPRELLRRLTGFDPDTHVTQMGTHVAELRCDNSPKVLPLSRSGLEWFRSKTEENGKIFGQFYLYELCDD